MSELTRHSIFDHKEQARFDKTGLVVISGFYSRKQIGEALAEIRKFEKEKNGSVEPSKISSPPRVLDNRIVLEGNVASIIAETQLTGEDLGLDLDPEQAELFPARLLELGPSTAQTYYIGLGAAAVIGLSGEIEWGIGSEKRVVEPGTLIFAKGRQDQPFRATRGPGPLESYTASLVLSGRLAQNVVPLMT